MLGNKIIHRVQKMTLFLQKSFLFEKDKQRSYRSHRGYKSVRAEAHHFKVSRSAFVWHWQQQPHIAKYQGTLLNPLFLKEWVFPGKNKIYIFRKSEFENATKQSKVFSSTITSELLSVHDFSGFLAFIKNFSVLRVRENKGWLLYDRRSISRIARSTQVYSAGHNKRNQLMVVKGFHASDLS